MHNIGTIFRRELASYFATPLAYIFIVIFLVMAGILAFFVGNFFERGQADLQAFFTFHPWLYLVLIPALSMRLWAEERKSGTIELFLTLPVSMLSAVLGKFLAAWACLSALTKNQVIAFVVTAAISFLFTVSGSPIVLGLFQNWAPDSVLSTISSFSFLTHFTAITRGVIDARDAVYFLSVIGTFLLANALLVDLKKAD